jgi:hypothetical protein
VPTVPTYQSQVREQALQGGFQRAPDNRDQRILAQGLGNLAEGMDRVAERDAQTEAWNAQAAINEDFVKWNAEARKRAQGGNAKGYAEEVAGWWDKAKQERFGSISPRAQQHVARALAQARISSLESASGYEGQQLEIANRAAFASTVDSLQSQAIAAGPVAAAGAIAAGADSIRQYGAQKGVDVEPEVKKFTTGVHTTFINTLLQTDPKAAEGYFTKNKGEIDAAHWDNIGAKINQVAAVTDGEAKATELWKSTVKDGDYNSPVDQFALEKQMREAYPNDPTRQKAGIQALREMTAAWNKSQAESVAGNVNKVFGMLDGGAPLTRVMRSNSWTSLPEAEQHKIRESLEAQAMAREKRASAHETRMERKLLLQNADSYLAYSDPQALASMSRPQVQALRPVFGLDGTKHLLDRYDALQKPGAISEARMDNDDFNHVADQMGLKPFAAKSEDDKKALGELKYRVEQMINSAQQVKKQPLTRDEKTELMRQEMARTVTVKGFFSNTDTPVIALKPDQLAKVAVPDADRAQIATALQTMYAKDQSNPLYAPTEDNMRRLYLMNKSRAARLINAPKP